MRRVIGRLIMLPLIATFLPGQPRRRPIVPLILRMVPIRPQRRPHSGRMI